MEYAKVFKPKYVRLPEPVKDEFVELIRQHGFPTKPIEAGVVLLMNDYKKCRAIADQVQRQADEQNKPTKQK